MFNMNLGFGMRNNDVRELQLRLNAETGSTLPGTTYYGGLTQAAAKAYQTMKGITPVSGYVGPLTRAALNGSTAPSGNLPAGCTSTAGYSSTTGVKCDSSGSGPVQTGSVTAMLATNNPASSTLVAGQATANLANFAFSGTGTVTNVTLQRIGVSADSTLSNVYLFDGATRLTDAASVSNNGMVTFNIPAGIFTVGGTKTISVRSDIAASTSGQTVGVKLVSFNTVGGSVVTANLSGNIHSVASATLATVAHNTVTPSGATINPGSNVTVWQDTLTISNRDVMMKRLALRNVGSAPASAFQNFKLYVNGIQVGTAAGVDSMGYVTFDMNAAPVTLAAGSRMIRVDADIVSGSSRTFQFSLRQAADADFVDSSFGVNVTPAATPWTSGAANTISGTSGGTLTIQRDNSSPSTSLVLNGNDVNLGTFQVTAYGEPIKIETLTAGFTFTDDGAANAAATLRNGRLLINGVQYGSSATLLAAGTSFTTNYTVMPGTSVMVEVHADVYDNDGTGSLDTSDTILAKIIVGSSNAQRIDSLGSFNAPTATVSANTLTIATGSMTLARNNTYGASQTTTLPVTNFKIGSWNLAGSATEDILLTTLSLDVDAVADNSFENGDLTSAYVVIKKGADIVAQPSPLSTVAAADNNFSINYTLLKSQNLTIELYANLADNGLNAAAGAEAITATDSFKTDLTVSGISLTGNTSVTATAADTDGQTIVYGAATLTATLDATSPVIALVADNQTVDSAAFKFSALTADAKVTDVTLTLGTNANTVVQYVHLYDGATLVGTMSGASTVTFSGLNFNVPANTSKTLTVKLQLGSIGLGAGTTGALLTTTMTDFTAVQAGVSDASANDAGPSIENNPAGAASIARAAVPTLSQSTVSSALTNAIENDLYKFVVTPTGGAVALKQLKFTSVITDNSTDQTLTMGSFKLYRGSTDITSLVDIHNTAGASIESGGTTLAEGTTTGIITWATEEQISVATEFTLKGTPSGFTVGAEDDSININLAYDSSAHTAANSYLIDLDTTGAQATIGLAPTGGAAQDDATHGTDGGTVTDGPNVIWSDLSALPHSETVVDAGTAATSSADWINGYLIQAMPLSGMTKTN